MQNWIRRALVGSLTLLATSVFSGHTFFRIVGPAPTEITGISQDGTLNWTNQSVGVNVRIQHATSLAGEGNWSDYLQQFVHTPSMAAQITDPNTPAGMVFVPGGQNTGINPLAFAEYHDDGYPETYNLISSSFYMDKYPVTKSRWDEVYNWAITNEYTFDHAGLGKATNHPVHTISWYDAIKWCNARSEKEGRQPAYYTTNLFEYAYAYRSGQYDIQVDWVRLNDGYRLPTETEWEYAARGGLSSKRFTLGDTISHADANFKSNTAYPYDLNTYYWQTYHQSYEDGTYPYTSPVGSFPANGYGLSDMGGNIWQWIFDWDPGSNQSGRIMRGGSWISFAPLCRVGNRYGLAPDKAVYSLGLRTVLSMQPQPIGTEEYTNVFSNTDIAVQQETPGEIPEYSTLPIDSACTDTRADDSSATSVPGDMTLIPAGKNCGKHPDFLQTYALSVDSFYIDNHEVTKSRWDEVYNWAITNGYTFDHSGLGKATNHPVHTISWYDAIKWSNARSEKEGRTPVYTLDGVAYKTGRGNGVIQTPASGYRLPTKAEWEYAARGGLRSTRFSWGNEINHSYANYAAKASSYSNDTSPYTNDTYHPAYNDGIQPYTSPVGSFAANGYGLFDMNGNLWELCSDWASGYEDQLLLALGGDWKTAAYGCRLNMSMALAPHIARNYVGFRNVLSTDADNLQ